MVSAVEWKRHWASGAFQKAVVICTEKRTALDIANRARLLSIGASSSVAGGLRVFELRHVALTAKKSLRLRPFGGGLGKFHGHDRHRVDLPGENSLGLRPPIDDDAVVKLAWQICKKVAVCPLSFSSFRDSLTNRISV